MSEDFEDTVGVDNPTDPMWDDFYFFRERSAKIDQLVGALVQAHANGLANVAKDAQNPYFSSKYATLAACVQEITPHLSKVGLVVIQLVNGPGRVKTILAHTSGQYICCELELPPVKNDPQAAGSAITYSRRYALPAIVGIATDDDDDGNAASGKAGTSRASLEPAKKIEPPPQADPVPDKKLARFMEAMFTVGTEMEKLLQESGEATPKAEVKERMSRLLGTEGFERLQDIHDSETRKRIYKQWQDMLAETKKFLGVTT